MSQETVTKNDEGKRVVDANGDTIGIISGVRNGKAYVDPDPGISEKILTKLGWENIDKGDYPLERSRIATITDDEIHLNAL